MATNDSKINNVVDASDTGERDDQKEAGIKCARVTSSSDDSSSSEEQKDKDEEETLIDSATPLQNVNLCCKKKLLVLPLAGIIVYRAYRRRPATIPPNRRPDFCYGNFLVYKRPFCVEFLKFCFEKFEVGLWSSSREHNLLGILTNVLGEAGELKSKLLFTWDQEHCSDTGFKCLDKKDKPLFLKELSHLWGKKDPNLPCRVGDYSASNTLLITDPVKAILNPPNTAIFPHSYDPENKEDDFLGPNGELRVFLNGLAEADDVQTYVKDHPIGEPAITASHPDRDYYYKIIRSICKKKLDNRKN